MTLLRRFLVLVVAVALAGAAVLVIVEAVGIRIGESPVLLPVNDWEQRINDGSWSRWSANAWRIASASALAAGVVLVVLQMIPHRRTTLERQKQKAERERETHFGRNGLEERLREIVVDQGGILGGKVGVSKRKVKVQAQIPGGGDTKSSEESVRAAVREDLDRLRLAKKQRVRVNVVHTDDRVI